MKTYWEVTLQEQGWRPLNYRTVPRTFWMTEVWLLYGKYRVFIYWDDDDDLKGVMVLRMMKARMK